MHLTAIFNLPSKSRSELLGLYRKLFNALASGELNKHEKHLVQASLSRIKQVLAFKR